MNRAMIAALGKTGELQLHCMDAFDNGASESEIPSIFHVIEIRGCLPQPTERFRFARRLPNESGKLKTRR